MSHLLKNTAGQKWRVFAFNRTTNAPVTGDAAQITAKISLDWAAPAAITDTNPTEAEDGFYDFTLTQAETNGTYEAGIFPESSTSNVQVIGVPGTKSIVDSVVYPADGSITGDTFGEGVIADETEIAAAVRTNLTTELAAVLAVPTAIQNSDAYLQRDVSNVEAAIKASGNKDCAGALILQARHSNTTDHPGFLTIYQTDNETEFQQIATTSQSTTNTVTGVEA